MLGTMAGLEVVIFVLRWSSTVSTGSERNKITKLNSFWTKRWNIEISEVADWRNSKRLKSTRQLKKRQQSLEQFSVHETEEKCFSRRKQIKVVKLTCWCLRFSSAFYLPGMTRFQEDVPVLTIRTSFLGHARSLVSKEICCDALRWTCVQIIKKKNNNKKQGREDFELNVADVSVPPFKRKQWVTTCPTGTQTVTALRMYSGGKFNPKQFLVFAFFVAPKWFESSNKFYYMTKKMIQVQTEVLKYYLLRKNRYPD